MSVWMWLTEEAPRTWPIDHSVSLWYKPTTPHLYDRPSQDWFSESNRSFLKSKSLKVGSNDLSNKSSIWTTPSILILNLKNHNVEFIQVSYTKDPYTSRLRTHGDLERNSTSTRATIDVILGLNRLNLILSSSWGVEFVDLTRGQKHSRRIMVPKGTIDHSSMSTIDSGKSSLPESSESWSPPEPPSVSASS